MQINTANITLEPMPKNASNVLVTLPSVWFLYLVICFANSCSHSEPAFVSVGIYVKKVKWSPVTQKCVRITVQTKYVAVSLKSHVMGKNIKVLWKLLSRQLHLIDDVKVTHTYFVDLFKKGHRYSPFNFAWNGSEMASKPRTTQCLPLFFSFLFLSYFTF